MLMINGSGLHGTGLSVHVSQDVAGSVLGGTFRLYTGEGYGPRSLLDEGDMRTRIGSIDRTIRSNPLDWNASASDVERAIHDVLEEYKQGVEGETPVLAFGLGCPLWRCVTQVRQATLLKTSGPRISRGASADA